MCICKSICLYKPALLYIFLKVLKCYRSLQHYNNKKSCSVVPDLTTLDSSVMNYTVSGKKLYQYGRIKILPGIFNLINCVSFPFH